MLGVNVRMDDILHNNMVLFEPREDTIHKVVESAGALLMKGTCTPAEAAKLRGVAIWAAGNTFGRVGRLRLRALKTRQYEKAEYYALSEQLHMGLNFLREVMPNIGPRTTRILGPTPMPTVVYSDASWPDVREGRSAEEAAAAGEPHRLGWIIFRPGMKPLGFSMELGREFTEALFPRRTQILAAEAVAVLAAFVLTPELVAGRELVWFIDNEAALSSLIRGSSRADDVGHIAACTQVAMLQHSSSAWFEWVDSASNPADGLSRDGVRDTWTLQQGWELREFPPSAFKAVVDFASRPDVTRITGMVPKGPVLPHDG